MNPRRPPLAEVQPSSNGADDEPKLAPVLITVVRNNHGAMTK